MSALSELELQPHQRLHCAGADIQDCFYTVEILQMWADFFCLRRDLQGFEVNQVVGREMYDAEDNGISPCITVLPWDSVGVSSLCRRSTRAVL